MNGKVKSCYSLGSQQAKRVSILGDNFIDNYRLCVRESLTTLKRKFLRYEFDKLFLVYDGNSRIIQ